MKLLFVGQSYILQIFVLKKTKFCGFERIEVCT